MAAFGFIPSKVNGDRANSGGFAEIPIAHAYATNIFNGDPVVLNAGHVQLVGGVPADNANPTIGPLVGCRYTDSDGNIHYAQYYNANGGSSNTDAFAYVATDENAWFRIQSNVAFADSQVGIQYALAAGAGGNTTTGNSSYSVNVTGGASAAGGVILMGCPQDGENENSSTPIVFVKWASGTHSDF
jgi:hypothetical protein